MVSPLEVSDVMAAVDQKMSALHGGYDTFKNECHMDLAVLQQHSPEKAMERVQKISWPTRKILALCELAVLLAPPWCEQALEEALSLSQTAELHATTRSAVYGQLAWALQMRGRFVEAAEHYQRALVTLGMQNNPGETGRSSVRYLFVLGRFEDAARLLLQAGGLHHIQAFHQGFLDDFIDVLEREKSLGAAKIMVEHYQDDWNHTGFGPRLLRLLARGNAHGCLLEQLLVAPREKYDLFKALIEALALAGRGDDVRRMADAHHKINPAMRASSEGFGAIYLGLLGDPSAVEALAKAESGLVKNEDSSWLASQVARACLCMGQVERGTKILLEHTPRASERWSPVTSSIELTLRAGKPELAGPMVTWLVQHTREQGTDHDVVAMLIRAAGYLDQLGRTQEASTLRMECVSLLPEVKKMYAGNLGVSLVQGFLRAGDREQAWRAAKKTHGRYSQEGAWRIMIEGLAEVGEFGLAVAAMEALDKMLKRESCTAPKAATVGLVRWAKHQGMRAALDTF
jgi:tetratricopeptide (TPR) repeat protein